MSEQNSKSPKEILAEVLTEGKLKELWTANYTCVFPFTPQGFSLQAVLSNIFYLFRWGQRRGKGEFANTFAPDSSQTSKKSPTIENVTEKLLLDNLYFQGFSEESEQAILGDLLLSFCLENKAHKLGRNEPLQRVYPTHYLSSWIDLPETSANLRNIPEMIVALLVDQPQGEFIEKQDKKLSKCLILVEKNLEDNLLLEVFGKGMSIQERIRSLTADTFNENCQEIGLDQLLSIRVAKKCGEAPKKAAGGKDKIDNQIPLTAEALKHFREDFRIFLRTYGTVIPRQSLLPMLESCLSISLTNIYLSTAMMLLEWEQKGKLPDMKSTDSWSLFVDCSNSNDHELRRLSEESTDELVRLFDRIPNILMCMRVLEQLIINYKPYMRKEKERIHKFKRPQATEYINFWGAIFKGEHPQSEKVLEDIGEICYQLADSFQENEQAPIIIQNLKNDKINSAMRLAETITMLMGDQNQRGNFIEFIDSCLMINQVNGLGTKRRRTNTINGQRKTSDARSIVLTNTMLDFLVHLHLSKPYKKGIRRVSFLDFIEILRERYGLYVEQSPPNMSIPTELLLRNKRFLERRLRDLGLLIGVNDAESMKRLQPRFEDNNYAQ